MDPASGIILVRGAPDGSETTGLLVPVEITVAFGFGTGPYEGEQYAFEYSWEVLENYLESVKLSRNGNLWTVKAKDAEGRPRIAAVRETRNRDVFLDALRSDGHTVVFDGHSNYGFGPYFGNAPDAVASVSDFCNFGVGYASLPVNARLRGPQPGDVLTWGSRYRHLAIPPQEIRISPLNYIPAPLPAPRFPNQERVGAGQAFQLHGAGYEAWHFHLDIPDFDDHSEQVIVEAPSSDLPARLGYRTFFFNACSTGPDYIENFRHATFVFTRRPVEVYKATALFVQGILENHEVSRIVADMNAAYFERHKNIEPYGYHDFQ